MEDCMKSLLTLVIAGAGICFAADKNSLVSSTAADRSDASITIYNSNLGLVRETRKVTLPTDGRCELRCGDVASNINSATVLVKALDDPKTFSVIEQNYEYDLISPSKLMTKYVGKQVKIEDRNDYTNTSKMIDATLISNNEGPVYKIGDQIRLGYPGQVILPQIPENLFSVPTLDWICTSSKSKQTLDISYLTSGMSWSADYVAVLDSSDSKIDLSGWITLNNQSGASFDNATLKLVAGDVNRVAENVMPAPMARHMAKAMMEDMAGGAMPTEESFFEYHLYTLPFKTSLHDNQTKQVSLLAASNVNAVKQFSVDGGSSPWNYRSGSDSTKLPVDVTINFRNSKENNLGMPMPKGTVRVYKRDNAGTQIFAGEDAIEHTPENEDLHLSIGKAFDIVAVKKQTDYVRHSDREHETAWEFSVRNHKKSAITLNLNEHFYGEWKIVQSSQPFKKTGAGTGVCTVSVPADGNVVVKYRVICTY